MQYPLTSYHFCYEIILKCSFCDRVKLEALEINYYPSYSLLSGLCRVLIDFVSSLLVIVGSVHLAEHTILFVLLTIAANNHIGMEDKALVTNALRFPYNLSRCINSIEE